MSRMDHSRPRFRRENRVAEHVDGLDVPREFWQPRKPAPSKASLRADADRAMQAFDASRIKKIAAVKPAAPASRPASTKPVTSPHLPSNEKPPWE